MGKFGEINSADTRAGKFPLVPMGGLSRGSRVRGHGSEDPLSALAEIIYSSHLGHYLGLADWCPCCFQPWFLSNLPVGQIHHGLVPHWGWGSWWLGSLVGDVASSSH